MLNRLLTGVAIFLVTAISLSACNTVKDYEIKDDYETKSEDFVLRMKWSDFIGASLHFKDDLREDFLERFEDWDELKVADIVMSRTKSELEGDTQRKIADYKLEYYLLNKMVVHKEKIQIIWELAPEGVDTGAYWRIVEPFPELEVEKK